MWVSGKICMRKTASICSRIPEFSLRSMRKKELILWTSLNFSWLQALYSWTTSNGYPFTGQWQHRAYCPLFVIWACVSLLYSSERKNVITLLLKVKNIFAAVTVSLKQYVCFSGYDFGYLLKLLTDQNLPQEESDFFELLRIYFPTVYDVKVSNFVQKIQHFLMYHHGIIQ